MSTKLMKADERQKRTGSPAERSGLMSERLTAQSTTAQPNLPAGNLIINVMTEQETSDLLARLQDILSLWAGSDNKIIGSYVMTAFPIPSGVDITKLAQGNGHDKVFCVNGKSVTAVMTEREKVTDVRTNSVCLISHKDIAEGAIPEK